MATTQVVVVVVVVVVVFFFFQKPEIFDQLTKSGQTYVLHLSFFLKKKKRKEKRMSWCASQFGCNWSCDCDPHASSTPFPSPFIRFAAVNWGACCALSAT
jgi:hypothetical protein